jgi:hypothetical protein
LWAQRHSYPVFEQPTVKVASASPGEESFSYLVKAI